MNKTLTAALILTALAACTEDGPAYPTDIRHVNQNGRDVSMFGADIGDVCEAIGNAACQTDRCKLEHFARCNPLGSGGRVEAPALETWDELWRVCLDGAEREGASFTGLRQVYGCERLTLSWVD